MELHAGLDLHSRNTYIGIMDNSFNRVFKKRVPNHLEQILQTLDPFRDQIKGFVVESTYNWYWLVDGLMDAGYSSAHLANPAAYIFQFPRNLIVADILIVFHENRTCQNL